MTVQLVSHALEEHGRLAATRHAVDDDCRLAVFADNGVLFLLNGGCDFLQTATTIAGENVEQEGIADGRVGIDHLLEGGVVDDKLLPRNDGDGDGAPVGLIASSARSVGIVRVSHGCPPIINKVVGIFIGVADLA